MLMKKISIYMIILVCIYSFSFPGKVEASEKNNASMARNIK
jgi:hypothetical protein